MPVSIGPDRNRSPCGPSTGAGTGGGAIITLIELYGGIDLGGTKVQTVVLDVETEQVLGQARHETPRDGPAAVVGVMAEAFEEALGAANVTAGQLIGIGVGSPGEVDSSAGTVTGAANIPGWERPFPVARVLSGHLGEPVAIANDVDVATRAEFELGAARQMRSLLGVFWGTGVGGGIVLDGRPWQGRGAAGEIGHTVVRLGGAHCTCGRKGCMEAYAGRLAMELRARRLHKRGRQTRLFEIMRERDRVMLSSGVWARALEEGDELAHELIARAIGALGAGVASAVNLLDVEGVVIGGGMGTRFGETMVARIAEAMQPHLFVDQRPPDVRIAALGDLAGAIGAALQARAAFASTQTTVE